MACAALGIPMKAVDVTKGCLDRNFHPHCLIVGGQRIQIANEDVLTTHASVTRTPPVLAERFSIGRPTVDVHLEALKDALPMAHIATFSEFFRKQAERHMALLEVMTRTDSFIWERFVSEDGTTQNCQPSNGWTEIARASVVGTNGSRSGWVSPNIVNILTDAVLDLVRLSTDTVYELSGPDMYRYIGQLMPMLNKHYDAIRKTLGWNLPETATYNLVPVADMRFAVPVCRRARLETLVDAWLGSREFESTVGDRLSRASDKNAELQSIKALRNSNTARLCDAMRACPDPFYDIYDGTYFSQYDLLGHTDGMFIHPWALETPVGVLCDTVRAMRKLLPSPPKP